MNESLGSIDVSEHGEKKQKQDKIKYVKKGAHKKDKKKSKKNKKIFGGNEYNKKNRGMEQAFDRNELGSLTESK